MLFFKIFFLIWAPCCVRPKLTAPASEEGDSSAPLSAQDGVADAAAPAMSRKKMPFANTDEAKWAHVAYGMLIASTIMSILSLATTSDYRADVYLVGLAYGFYAVHERDATSLGRFFYVILVFLALDLFWLIFHAEFTRFSSVTGGATTAAYVYGMTVICYVLKVFTLCPVVKLKQTYLAEGGESAADVARQAGNSSSANDSEPSAGGNPPIIAEPQTPAKDEETPPPNENPPSEDSEQV